MAIGFRSSATASIDGGTLLTLPVPSGVQAGDFMIAHISYRQGQNSPVTPPAGWTLLRSEGSFADSGGASGYIYYRVATGSEPASYGFTLQDFREAAGGIAAYTGVKNANPVDVSSASTSTGTTAPSAPTITTLYTAPWLIWFLAARDNISTDTATPPSGFTQRWRVNASAPGCVSLVAEQVFSGPGASGAQTGAISPSGHTVTQMLFLSPADEFPNHPPIANAGPDKSTEIGVPVTFDGSGSDQDPGDTITFAWTHVSGPNNVANLSDATSPTPDFTPTATGTDIFRLTVTDHPTGATASDDMTVSTLPTGVRFNKSAGLGTSATCVIPSGAAAGDIALFAICSRPNSPPTVAGWNAVVESTLGGSSTDISLFVFIKRLDSGDPGTTVTAAYPTLFDFFWSAQVVTVRNMHPSVLQVLQMPTQPLHSPNNFANSVVGAAGTATYEYTITATDAAGETIAATTTTVGGAPNTLTSSNYVQLTWAPIYRGRFYNIYGRTSGNPRLLATIDQTPITPIEDVIGYLDQGATPGSQQPPTQQPIGWLLDGLGSDWQGTLLPERLFTTFAAARLVVFASGHLTTPNASAEVSDPAGTNPIGTSVSDSGDLVLHSSIETLGAAGDVGTRLFTPTDYTPIWATAGILLRPTGANGTPTAIAGYDQEVEIGDTVHLDGSQSYDDDGDPLTYAWTQTAGPSVTLSDSTAVFPTFTMPKSNVTFTLKVTDPSGALASDTVTISTIKAGVKVKRTNGSWGYLN